MLPNCWTSGQNSGNLWRSGLGLHPSPSIPFYSIYSRTLPMKFLHINLGKHVQDLYAENYKTLYENQIWYMYVLGLEDYTLFSILPKLVYRINATPIKIPAWLFIDIWLEIIMLTLKFTWKGKRKRIAKNDFEIEPSWRIYTTWFQDLLYYKATLIKTVWYWQKDGHIYQWNRIESRNKPTQMCSTDFLTKCKVNSIKKGYALQQIVQEPLDNQMYYNIYLYHLTS